MTALSEEVRTVINKYRETFTRDTNLGLVNQVSKINKFMFLFMTNAFFFVMKGDVIFI